MLADEEGRAALDCGIYGAPETFVVDAQGIIRWKHVGPIDDAIVRDELEPLFADLERARGRAMSDLAAGAVPGFATSAAAASAPPLSQPMADARPLVFNDAAEEERFRALVAPNCAA